MIRECNINHKSTDVTKAMEYASPQSGLITENASIKEIGNNVIMKDAKILFLIINYLFNHSIKNISMKG